MDHEPIAPNGRGSVHASLRLPDVTTPGGGEVSGEPALTLVGLRKRYGSVDALKGLDLAVRKGELVALLGPSGCGKTTTLQIIAGFVRADAGDVLLDGVRVNDVPPHRRNIGVVFQDHALFPHMRVEDNVGFGLRMRRIRGSEVQRRVQDALELVQLSDKGRAYPDQLSGGQQQRVALARAIVIEPTVLLLDEPLSSLDRSLRETLRWEIERIHRETRMTTIFVTHDQEEAMALSDRIAVMQGGIPLQVDSPVSLYEDPQSVFVARFFGGRNVIPGVVRAVDDEVVSVDLGHGMGVITVPGRGKRFPVGAETFVAFSPEDMMVKPLSASRSGGDKAAALGEILGAEFSGAGMSLRVAVDEQIFRVALQGHEHLGLRPGDHVEMSWRPESLRLVAPSSTD